MSLFSDSLLSSYCYYHQAWRHRSWRCCHEAPAVQCKRLQPSGVQFQAVHWMLRRERDLGPRPHPTVRDLTAAAGAPLFVCTATGTAEVTAPPDTAHCRGGFFCDEPVRRHTSNRSLTGQHLHLRPWAWMGSGAPVSSNPSGCSSEARCHFGVLGDCSVRAEGRTGGSDRLLTQHVGASVRLPRCAWSIGCRAWARRSRRWL